MASAHSISDLANMLPLPGSPGSSWSRFRDRLKVVFKDANPRVCVAFWLFGKPMLAYPLGRVLLKGGNQESCEPQEHSC